MCKIVNSFTADTGLNDVLVHGFVCRRKLCCIIFVLCITNKTNKTMFFHKRVFISQIHDTYTKLLR